MLATASIILFVVVLGLLVAMSTFGVSRIEAAHPPAGHFILVDGVRLHVAELGLAPGSPGAEPAVVLIHGASGNMEDMRLALGEKLAATHRVILIDRPGHGWSSRPSGDTYASPASQAELVAKALQQLSVRRAILVGHSWGGAFATAYALAFPERTAGLVLLSAVTHPWPGDPGWYNNLVSLRGIGPLFLRTLVYPLGSFMIDGVSRSVFEPQAVPPDYVRRAAIRLVLRPKTFFANARDLALLRNFIAAQVPELCRSARTDHHHHRRLRHHGLAENQCLRAAPPHCRARNLFFSRASVTCRITPRPRRWRRRSIELAPARRTCGARRETPVA